jgi:predicted RNase H-like nuclease (RuvC/YqgF family)|tara:strand:+ start:30 stop:263 length:234 start_codon:yes stop_codon:yes gene_type:complete
MMTNKDCKDFEDIMRKINPKGPNDLEEQIRVLKFRNEKLHNQNEKQTKEILELRKDNKKLAEELSDKIQLFRDKGVL